jgi:protein required for attachment to host cells
MDIWYMVADGARARLFKTTRSDGPLTETDGFVNEKGRMNNRDLSDDRPGRSFKGGAGRTAMEKGDGPREEEEKKFAKRLAKFLNEAYRDGKFERLGIVGAPKALGRIVDALDNAVVEALLGTSSKNYTRHSVEEIREHITEDLR